MSLLKNKKFQIFSGVFFGLVIVVILIVLFSGADRKTATLANNSARKGLEGFTFFDLGADSRFSDNVRDGLEDKLGSDAIEQKNVLDLTVNYKGFLRKYFKDLDELNQKLNFPPGERVEHNTFKLMYRHSQNREVPFEYVELIFSNYTQKPLLFRISSPKEGAFIVDTIRQKYGAPKVIEWDQGRGRSLHWEKDQSILIITIGQDRYGDPEYHTVIYYVPNLKELLFKELQEAQKHAEEIKQKGKTAF
ncbi:MAG: hypothetical protein KKH68_08755 [Proteobacteria bacterium]|nr:hypothetical protein [Pseudomonadota bacterium]